jgi:dienelactone hydrolase
VAETVAHVDQWRDAFWVSYQLQRAMAMSMTGGADVGECLWLASKIDPHDLDTWATAWKEMAEEVEAIAAEPGRSKESIRDANFRASTYWRTALFFLDPGSDQALDWYRRSQETFRKGAALLPNKVTPVEIPYEGTVLEGYFMEPEGDRPGPWPVIIFGGTMDTPSEEHYFAFGRTAAERGFAVLLLDGPGAGASLRNRGTTIRHDYEVPTGLAIDWLLEQGKIDPNRIIIMGWGHGGYYAMRAAAFEPRLAGCLCWNTWRGEEEDEIEMWRKAVEGVSTIDELRAKAAADPSQEWVEELDFVLRHHGPKSPEELVAKVSSRNLTGVVEKITVPLLVIVGGDDDVGSVPDTEKLFEESGSKDKTLKIYPANGPASRHVMVDGITRAQADMADWLVSRFL